MKPFYKSPETELRIVRPDNQGYYYEFWVVVPHKLGEATRVGNMRVLCDGLQFSNLNTAFIHKLNESAEFKSLANQIEPWVIRNKATVTVTGTDLVTTDKWNQFAKMRQLRTTPEALGREYQLTRAEIVELGLETSEHETSRVPASIDKRARYR